MLSLLYFSCLEKELFYRLVALQTFTKFQVKQLAEFLLRKVSFQPSIFSENDSQGFSYYFVKFSGPATFSKYLCVTYTQHTLEDEDCERDISKTKRRTQSLRFILRKYSLSENVIKILKKFIGKVEG